MTCNCNNEYIKRVIGVTRTFNWTVTTGGEDVSLEGRNLTLQLMEPRGSVVDLPFSTTGDVVSFTWQGDDQTKIGLYSLILWENYGEDSQRRVDIHNFVELIPWSDNEQGTYSDLTEETITLETSDFGADVIVEDNLTSTSTSNALSANMGRVLNITKQDVIADLATIRSGAAAGAAVKEWAKNDVVITDDGTQATASKLSFNGNIFEQWISGVASSITLKGIAGFLKLADISQWGSAYNDRMLPTVAAVKSKIDAVANALATIGAVIPSQASSSNKLTDKNYVDGAIATNTANFVGTFATLAELQAVQNPTKNDYGFVIEQDAQGNEYYDRYKYTGSQWLFEYKVESTPFTAEQWAAIQSGITAALVSKLSALPTNAELNTALAGKQPVINDLPTIRSGAAAGATAYQKPSGGIPASDMASAVQTSLGKADAALSRNDMATVNGSDLTHGGNVTIVAAEGQTITIDAAPTAGSNNAVSSGGVATQFLDTQLLITGDVWVSDWMTKKNGYIERNGVITTASTWFYGVVAVKAGQTLNVVTELSEGNYPFMGIAASGNVGIGDSVTIIHGVNYTAEQDVFIVLSIREGNRIRVKLISQSFISQQTENTPTLGSNKLVNSNGIKKAIDDVDDKFSQITLQEQIPANYVEGKAVKVSGSTYEVYNANGYIVSVLIPYTANTQLTWYSGFITQDLTKQLIFLNSSRNYSTYWNSYANSGFVASVYNTINGFILATFYLRDDYDCRLEDGDGNVVYRPTAEYSKYYVNPERIKNNTAKETNGADLFIGNVVNISPKISGADVVDTKVATMDSSILVPYRGIKMTFTLPEYLNVGIITASSGIGTTTISSYFSNGDSYTLPQAAALYRLFFIRVDNTDIDVEDVNAMIESGDIRVVYNNYNSDIITDNSCAEKYLKAIMYQLHIGRDVLGENYVPNMPVFAHISDIHGDAERLKRCLDYCQYLGVCACLISGDQVNFNATNGQNFVDYISANYTFPVLVCIGNHDNYTLTSSQQQYEQIVKRSILSYESIAPDSVIVPYPTYYYKDIEGIRVIVLNQFDNNVEGYISQAQADFFVNALLTTPNEYGVIVMAHSPEKKVVKILGSDKFYQDSAPGGESYYRFDNSEDFIRQIIDTFIARGTLSRTFIKDGQNAVTVNIDFTLIDTSVKFLMQVTGHEHGDRIGLAGSTSNNQLMFNITTGASIYGLGVIQAEWADDSDLPRGGKGSVQDAFNIYAIDKETETIRIARIGSNVTNELKDRNYMVVNY